MTTIAINDLKEQPLNARVMSPATFERLAENIRSAGKLESLPYCAQPNGRGDVEIVSGHHRVRAARAAGMTTVPILLDRAALTRSQITAKQLAHNALAGEDVNEVLDQLLRSIEADVDALLESGLSDRLIPPEGADVVLHHPDLDLTWKTVAFAFLPRQFDQVRQLVSELHGADLIGIAHDDQFRAFMDAIASYGIQADITSMATVITELTRIALDQLHGARGDEAPDAAPGH